MAKHRRPDESEPGPLTPAARAATPPPPWATGLSSASTQPQRPAAPEPDEAAALAGDAGEISPVAAGLRNAAASLKGIAAGVMIRQYEARSDDGGVTVTVDGGGRVAGVRIGEYAIRSGPDRLGASIAVAVNRALEAARQGTTESLLDAVAPESQTLVRGAIGAASYGPAAAAAQDAVAQTVTARSGDGSVTATASGLCVVTSITLSPAAVRAGRDGPARLGASAAEAVNAALAEAGSLRRAQLSASAGPAPAPGDPRSAGSAALTRLSDRMNELLGTLDQIDRDLDQLVDSTVSDLTRLAGQLPE
jgi:DNA-binding protein YbaB